MKNNIKAVRENAKLTQQECADIFGVTIRAWQTYEQGVSEPKFEVLCKIADYFNVTVDFLLGRDPLDNPLAILKVKMDDKKFIEMYSALPDHAKQIFVDIMLALKETNTQAKETPRAYDEYTLGEIDDMKKADQDAE